MTNPYQQFMAHYYAQQPLVVIPGSGPGAHGAEGGHGPTPVTLDQLAWLQHMARALKGNIPLQEPESGVGMSGSADPLQSPLTHA